MNFFKKLGDIVTGSTEFFTLEHRIFNISSFFITTFGLIGAVANYSIGLDPVTVWLSLAGAAVSFVLYYNARVRHIFSAAVVITYVVSTIILLSVIHFYNGGLDGNLFYLIIMMLNIFLMIVPTRFQFWIYGVLYSNLVVLLLLEYKFPEWVLPYNSLEDRMVDHAVTMFYSLFYTTIVIVTFRKSYTVERQKVMDQNKEILEQRERLELKKRELEDSVAIANERLEHINTLLRELNHRVKNNLQVVSSLLNLQAHSIKDETARKAILESKNRLLSMILIHQRLYQNENTTDVCISEYLRELTETIMYTYSRDYDDDMLEFDIEPVLLHVEMAVPLGLICNELITNAFKHAFYHTPDPLLRVSFKEQEEEYILNIEDNGSSLPVSSNKKGFGMGLVASLVKQLNGSMMVASDNGTHISIGFSKIRIEKFQPAVV